MSTSSSMSQLQVFLTLVCIVVGATIIHGDATPTGCPNYPDSPIMNDEFRNYVLDLVNGYRSQVAKGIFPSEDNNGTFPSGKNINKLSWDCRIEAAARETSETCITEYRVPDFEYSPYGEMYFVNESASESPQRAMEILIYDRFFKDKVEGLRSVSGETVLHHPRRRYMTDKIEGFACWFGSKNCNAAFNEPNPIKYNISAICGFSPALPYIPLAPNGIDPADTPRTYVLGPPCSIDSDCTNPNGFTKCDAALGLCTKTSTAPPSTTPAYNPCAAGWFYFSNACYRNVNGSTNRSHAQAEQWCKNQGKNGHLVSIHNEAENNFIKSLIASGGDNVLIGYNNETWTDASPVDYTDFPTNCGNNVCAAFELPNYQWKPVDCNGPFKQFICKRNL